ncbi:hypothetical protein MC7420_2780 [Coleofasciculus chthonoplastes PCC 7420]|uniref:Uncharacterized protein n=1 Tax=Coleofasciculus chthonoplastes PCC 7420 TaxID=118168 RepID=B4W3S0_9CYAN|nr:hypothetical protein MC7420_2780 [Coleofasciculus chthonoplastes PCC 7420]
MHWRFISRFNFLIKREMNPPQVLAHRYYNRA